MDSTSLEATSLEAVVAECNFLLDDEERRQWLIRRHTTILLPLPIPATSFTVVELPGRSVGHDLIFLVLVEASTVIANMSVDLDDPESCKEVTGSIKMISTQTPCISSVGALWQFKICFPGVRLEFAEQDVETDGV